MLEHRIAYLEATSRPDHPFSMTDEGIEPTVAPHAPLPQQASDGPKDQHGEDLQDLASKVGTLSLNAAGAESQYLGSSSIFAFARLIKPMLNQISVAQQAHTTDQLSEYGSPEMCQLPDPVTAVILSNAYFENVHTQYPFLNEPVFREWESSIVLSQGDQQWLGETIHQAALFFLNIVSHAIDSDQHLFMLPGICCWRAVGTANELHR